MKIILWHNIMWSRYKAAVFSALHTLCVDRQIQLQVYQIAETANQRTGLSPIDMTWHKYPHELLFKGSYENIPRLALFWRVAKEAWAHDADVTILAGYDRPEYWIQAIILVLRGKAFACFCDSTLYDNPQKVLTGLLKTVFFRWCSGIFCYGRRAAEYVQLYGATPNKIIHRCQAAALYDGYTPESALERRLATYEPSRPARFLYVGRFSHEKSIDHLILGFDRLRKTLPDSHLILVGGGPEETRLKTLCARLSIQENVTFAGAKYGDDLFSEYLRATALILPSYSEPWGLVVNEALSHGCPIVVSDRCGCVPELVVEGKTGFSFPWGEIEELEEKMRLIAESEEAETISRMCLRQIAHFTPESAARSILDGSILLAGSRN
ncbi:glycosyltransferase family 4 protein [Bradyrhizobium sp. CW7]|uniref:glycosyltransferase n=1 Tax=Bradyrhizobium sp. CW7 TaxID=2782688 RepID=UPI001FF83A73|nr:glycosyltransferase [Bradyrhizobium sp. CW7]MCK1353553.1 glycosyltransferase family 4 protein [Bradyrhizobium sp. CW7]